MLGSSQLSGAEVCALNTTPLCIDTEVSAMLSVYGITALPLYTPQAYSFPAITYQTSGIDRPTYMNGPGIVAMATINLTAWSTSMLEVATLASRLRNAMHGQFRVIWGNTQIQSCILSADTTLYNEPQDSSDVGVYQRVLTFTIAYVESSPTGSGF